MGAHVIGKDKFLVFVSQIQAVQQMQDRVFGNNYITFRCHATDLRGSTLSNLDFKVLAPAILAEVVTAGKTIKLIGAMGCDANGTRLTLRG